MVQTYFEWQNSSVLYFVAALNDILSVTCTFYTVYAGCLVSLTCLFLLCLFVFCKILRTLLKRGACCNIVIMLSQVLWEPQKRNL